MPGGVIRDSVGPPILSLSGPRGRCSVCKAELLSLKICLHEASGLNLWVILIEGDSFCVICWAMGLSKAPWVLLDVLKEVMILALSLDVSSHIKRCANSMKGWLAK